MEPFRNLAAPQVSLIPSGDQLIGRDGVGKARGAEAGSWVELVSVPGALEIAVAHETLAERAILVRAHIGERVEGAVLAHDGDALAVDVDGGGASFGQLREGAEQDEAIARRGCWTIASGLLDRGRHVENRHHGRHADERGQGAPRHWRVAEKPREEV